MPTFIVKAYSTSDAFPVDYGGLVTVTAGSGATAVVEYTLNSPVDVANGVATWAAWAKGSVTAGVTASDIAFQATFVRVKATGGTVTLTTDNPTFEGQQLQVPWRSQVTFENAGGGTFPAEENGASSSESGAGNQSAITKSLEAAFAAGGGRVTLTVPGTYSLAGSLIAGNYTSIYLGAGVTLKQTASTQNAMLRLGTNVRFNGTAQTVTAFQILYADSTCPAGAGSLTYNLAGQTLTWTAPGDTAGAATDVSTATFLQIPSGTAGKALYVVSAVQTQKPAGNRTDAIIVSSITDGGAKAATAASTSNVLTVTETAHGRSAGDMVEVFSPTGRTLWTTYTNATQAFVVGTIQSVTDANTYTVNTICADFTSEAIVVQGQHHINVFGPGRIDQNLTNNAAYTSTESYAILARNTSKAIVDGVLFRDCYRPMSPYQASDWTVQNLTGENCVELYQFEGTQNNIYIRNCKSAGRVGSPSGDDFTAHTMTDAKVNAAFAYNGCPFVGDISNIDVEGLNSLGGHISGIKCTLSTNATVRNFNVKGVYGKGSAAALVFVDDTLGLVGGIIEGLFADNIEWQTTNTSGQEIANITMSGNHGTIRINGKWSGSANAGGLGVRVSPSTGANTISELDVTLNGKVQSTTVTGTSASSSTDITGCPAGTSTRLAVGQIVSVGPGILFGQAIAGNYYIASFPLDTTIRLNKAVGAGFGAGTFTVLSGVTNSVGMSLANVTVNELQLSPKNVVFNGVTGAKLFSAASSAGAGSLKIHDGSVVGAGGFPYIVERASGVGTFYNIFYSNLSTIDTRGLLDEGAAQTAALRIYVDNVQQHAASTGITLGTTTPVTVNIGNWNLTSLGNKVIQDNATAVVTVNCHGRLDATSQFFNGSGTSRTVYNNGQTFAPAFSATPAFALSNGGTFTPGTMTANITSITLTDFPPAGERISFTFTQDATAGRTIVWPASCIFPSAWVDAIVTTDANKKCTVTFTSNGAQLFVSNGLNKWA